MRECLAKLKKPCYHTKEVRCSKDPVCVFNSSLLSRLANYSFWSSKKILKTVQYIQEKLEVCLCDKPLCNGGGFGGSPPGSGAEAEGVARTIHGEVALETTMVVVGLVLV